MDKEFYQSFYEGLHSLYKREGLIEDSRLDDTGRIKNYTPHEITLMGENGQIIARFPSEGVARCQTFREEVGVLFVDGIPVPVNSTRFGQVEGLPEPNGETLYITSLLVAQALKGQRDDILITDDAVRDEQGRIIGCRALAQL